MFDFDYEDPALDALLGLEGNKMEKDEVRVKDKAFAEVRSGSLVRERTDEK